MTLDEEEMSGEKHPSKSERGQSLVEFAFGAVVLLILLSVIVDGARALFTYLSMRDAAQEGALYASYMPTDSAGIINRVRSTSDLMNGMGAAITITITPTVSGKFCMGTTSSNPHGITVQIDYPAFPLAMPFVGTFIGAQSVPISALVTDTILTPKCP
jgi:Flp pilus assembly protein TadG